MLDRTEDVTVKAFELAYFVHRDRDLALQIATEAWAALNAHFRPQRKRSFYRLRGRSIGGAKVSARTKITLESAQKLQLLVYIRSEQFERKRLGGRDRTADLGVMNPKETPAPNSYGA
jgi:hypothetical protein